ncbi:50S ribosomal protein L20 [Spiroplasma melliferum]|uniref:Large ribosomal subunit protein bL20 n=2 Tax=Spiroplasma melliferum TaxID=2134 RepID=A0AAI9T3X9_SPIME|nr:50S ribosomal protein L20 [Spiroplasma melliferum]ELL44558.1 50S ribosomal protein L20 [Spiroplasma melliferum IPMB4A]KAI93021.1 50S ribosomal protein L20 [Spiroplasma melliferum KC3]QCO24065.1 50S ribosomal protein L20 [Spiroplasma melliferum]
MARVKGGSTTRKRRKKIIKEAKGYFGTKSTHYKKAKEQVMKSWAYAFRDRKQRKRDFRSLWIQRINAAVREHDMSYSQFMNGLNKTNIEVNRKMLSELAIHNPSEFKVLVEKSKQALKN